MSRYLEDTADTYWEVVVDSRTPEFGYTIFLEERRTGRRIPVRTARSEKEMRILCKELQKDLLLSAEEFKEKYRVDLSPRRTTETS